MLVFIVIVVMVLSRSGLCTHDYYQHPRSVKEYILRCKPRTEKGPQPIRTVRPEIHV